MDWGRSFRRADSQSECRDMTDDAASRRPSQGAGAAPLTHARTSTRPLKPTPLSQAAAIERSGNFQLSGTARSGARPRAAGKFIFVGHEKLYVRGATYPFRSPSAASRTTWSRVYMLTHERDCHPDHRATVAIVQQALGGAGIAAPALLSYEVLTPVAEYDQKMA